MNKNKKTILIIVVLYIALFGAFLLDKNKREKLEISSNFSNIPENEIVENDNNDFIETEEIFIHLSGEVNYPGLIKLKKGQRLYEAINMAGGATDYADLDLVNLALVLSDQDKIYIPRIGEEAPSFLITQTHDLSNSKININKASKEELIKLDGIGDKTADAIIKYRDENGFNQIEDIMNVPGIGQGKYNRIKEDITI